MTETTLQTTEQWYRGLGDVAPGFLWLTDLSGRILYANRTWEQYTGSTLQEINGGGWAQFHHPDEVPAIQQKWGRAVELEQQFETELRYRRYDGAYRWMLARVVPLRDSPEALARKVREMVDARVTKP